MPSLILLFRPMAVNVATLLACVVVPGRDSCVVETTQASSVATFTAILGDKKNWGYSLEKGQELVAQISGITYRRENTIQ